MIGEGILVRSPNLGCIELRKAIQIYLAQSRGIIADIEQIVIGSGSEYLYNLIIELLGRDLVYAIESPSYKKIEQVYSLSEVEVQKLPLSQNGIESVALKKCSADVLHISPYRSYPSGVTASASKRHEYLKWAEKEGRYIIEDDFESEFSVSKKPEETLFCHSLKDNVIYMNTFSKTISSSLRVGYMVLPKKLSKEYEERLGFYSCTVPTYIQIVLAELIANGDFERHINRVRRNKRKELSQKGICVISGLAQGIDTAAHLGAMHQKGKTIAVLGNGLDTIYPTENISLAKEILKTGAVGTYTGSENIIKYVDNKN